MHTGVIPYLQHLSYFGIFFLLAFLDALIPLPEEIILIMVGYTVYFDPLDPTVAIVISIAAFLTGDNVTFWLSRGGSRLIERFKNRIAAPLIETYSSNMSAKAGLTLLIMTFVPNIRFFAPIVAGSVGTPWRKFIIYDSIAVGLYVSLYLLAGYFFHSRLDQLISEFELLGHLLIYLFLLVAGVWLGFFTRKLYTDRTRKHRS
jgi:membrane protein DedA with SNARE-associated domain